MVQVTTDQCRKALESCDSPAAKDVVNNSDLLAMFVGVVNGSLGALEGNAGAALGVADKWSTVAGFAGKAAQNKNVQLASSSAQIITQSLSLVKLGTAATPGMVVATVGAVFTKKVSLMFGLVENDKQAKLVAATTDLAASLLSVGTAHAARSAAVAAAAAAGGAAAAPAVATILLVAACAQLGVSAYQAYSEYTAD